MAINQSEYIHAMAEDPETGKPMQKVKVEGLESNSIQPYDHQATLTNTAVTHTSAIVAPGASSWSATWLQVPEGMTEFVANLVQDNNATTVTIHVQWSEDGTNPSGKTANTTPSNAQGQKTSNNWLAVGGAFFKVDLFNGDAAPRTCSANIKFRP